MPPTNYAPSSATPVMSYLRQDPAGGALLPTAERLMELRQALIPLLPSGIAAQCEICGLEEGNLVLEVPTPSASSKLRQSLPNIRQNLCHLGWQINSIRLRVQPRRNALSTFSRSLEKKQGQMSETAIRCIEETKAKIEPSPLRTALELALKHHLRR